VERVFDIHPYPRSATINIVVLDTKGAWMATARPEINKAAFYYKNEQIPII
jgi:hypothetical protein